MAKLAFWMGLGLYSPHENSYSYTNFVPLGPGGTVAEKVFLTI
jgi:hypothetical protein